jgi:hypothetical protein
MEVCRTMGEASMDAEGRDKIVSPEELFIRFQTDILQRLPAWKQRIAFDPGSCPVLEVEIQREFARGSALVMAGLLAFVMKLQSFDEACETTRSSYDFPLEKGRMRSLKIQLLGGLVIWIKSMYCQPKRKIDPVENRNVPGLYIELAQFGFAGGSTPGTEALVVRRVAACHSFDFAVKELRHDGMKLDYKAVRRLAYRAGQDLLILRVREMKQWRLGKLLSLRNFAGRRVVAQIDGGRLKTRSSLTAKEFAGLFTPSASPDESMTVDGNRPDDGGRVKAKKRHSRSKRFTSEWREPKLFIIYVLDENGRQDTSVAPWIEATLEGPDALAELVAMRLTQLGADEAESLTFVSDGAPWIWDRLDRIVKLAGIPKAVPVHQVLDCCHAIHHVHLGVKALEYDSSEAQSLYRAYRKQIRDGQWQAVVAELGVRAEQRKLGQASQDEVKRVCNYLERHGSSGHMNYPAMSIGSLPIGSGAVESSIRRVINLRLKSNGVFWRAENAESMLQLRCHYISHRLDERLAAKRISLARNAQRDWTWVPQDMRSTCDHSPANSA